MKPITFPLILVRHGISCANLAKRLPTPFLYPDRDPELTRVGQEVAVKRGAQLRAYLAKHAFRRPQVGASMRRRAQQTAALMMNTAHPLRVPHTVGSPQKEDSPDVPAFLDWLANRRPSTFVLFTHGKFIDALVRHAVHRPLPKTERPHYSAFLFYITLIPSLEPSVSYGGPLPYAKGPSVHIDTRKQCAGTGDGCRIPVCSRTKTRKRKCKHL
jgi:broad specificity phosphatase PhoE